MSVRLIKGDRTVELANPVHVDAFKANGWEELPFSDVPPAVEAAEAETVEEEPKTPPKRKKK